MGGGGFRVGFGGRGWVGEVSYDDVGVWKIFQVVD